MKWADLGVEGVSRERERESEKNKVLIVTINN
jgi:hypothetical protein